MQTIAVSFHMMKYSIIVIGELLGRTSILIRSLSMF